jgi:hypothetical protein
MHHEWCASASPSSSPVGCSSTMCSYSNPPLPHNRDHTAHVGLNPDTAHGRRTPQRSTQAATTKAATKQHGCASLELTQGERHRRVHIFRPASAAQAQARGEAEPEKPMRWRNTFPLALETYQPRELFGNQCVYRRASYMPVLTHRAAKTRKAIALTVLNPIDTGKP